MHSHHNNTLTLTLHALTSQTKAITKYTLGLPPLGSRPGGGAGLEAQRLGVLHKLLEQIDKYRIDIIAIQEIRWLGKGSLEKENHTIYYSCDERLHAFGTGFVIGRKLRQQVIDFKAVNPRVCVLRIRGKFKNYSIISAHAPTEVAADEDKEAFYDLLERTFDQCPNYDIKIIAGDMNAKVGKEDIYRPTIGNQSLHDTSNNNGQRLVNFAASRNLVIGGTLFLHKNIHKGTWTTPNGDQTNQIDRILISARNRSDLQDVRSYRGANLDSDHYLVLARIHARISVIKCERGQRIMKYNVDRLKNEQVQREFTNSIDAHLRGMLTEENSGIDHRWEECYKAIKQAAIETLGERERGIKAHWFNEECRSATDKKNEAYRKMIQRTRTRALVEGYRRLRREEKRIHQRTKRAWENKKLETIENLRFDNQRLLPHVENKIGSYQCGFRQGRSTIDQIFSLRMILEKGREYKMQTHHLFIDFKSAYDSIEREELYRAMEELNVPKKLIRLVRLTMSTVRCTIRVQAGTSEEFLTRKGVRQGDALACLLFNIALERVMRETEIQIGGTIFNKSVQVLA
ncbi:uncharacterized protein [Rhodnius prolixus]|uniref:uncharacterized protein n=1 Tax=Rhodnius prolixus TaxID=13249 RepID=UPI003D18E85F